MIEVSGATRQSGSQLHLLSKSLPSIHFYHTIDISVKHIVNWSADVKRSRTLVRIKEILSVPRRSKDITRQGGPIEPQVEAHTNLIQDEAVVEGEPSTASNNSLGTNLFGRIATEAAANLPPTKPAKLTDEEEAPSWRKALERATLPNKVKKLEEKVEKLQRRGLRGGRRKVKLTKEQLDQLRRAGLTERQEQVLLLRIEYAMKPAAIARTLGIDPSSVRDRLKAAFRKMDKAPSPRKF